MEASAMSVDHEHPAMPRRDVLCGGGAVVFGALVTALLGGAKPVRAQAIAGAVPEVDSLAVRVAIDSSQFAVAPGARQGNDDLQQFGWGISAHPPARTLTRELGLAVEPRKRRGQGKG